MKKGIHPEYKLTTIRCACGAEYHVPSTRESQRLEICGSCHPFFTGRQKLVDTAGRVEKFNRRFAKFAKPAAAPAEGTPPAEAPAEAPAETPAQA